MPNAFTLQFTCEEDAALATDLSEKWGFNLNAPSQTGLVLDLSQGRLSLKDINEPKMGMVSVDFASDALRYRQQQVSIKKEAIAKAVGLKGDAQSHVLDGTAGLGRDAFILACLGARVTLFERSPVVAALLENGLARAASTPELSWINDHMSLHAGQSAELMSVTSDKDFDAVYLDPMFPHKKKSALVKKEMRLFQQLLGPDEDADSLLEPALAIAKHRVVVKRPDYAPFMADKTPSMQIKSKKHRFDVYIK